MVFERAKKAALEPEEKVIFRHIDTSSRDVFLEWGFADDLFIDDKKVRT